MATQAYHNWVADGRPWELAWPLRAYRAALRGAGFSAASVGTLGDDGHLWASRPQDHCPFSATGWPHQHPYPFVLALDLSGTSDGGTSWLAVARYWVSEAMAGRTPWVKYITLTGQRFDVRNDWEPVEAEGHYEHVHVSIRTDHVYTDTGDWPVLPGGEGMTLASQMLRLPEEVYLTGKRVPPSGGDEEVDAATALAWALRNAHRASEYAGAVYEWTRTHTCPAIDAEAVGRALAASPAFIDAVATAIAGRVGMLPTAREIASAVGELNWQGRAV